MRFITSGPTLRWSSFLLLFSGLSLALAFPAAAIVTVSGPATGTDILSDLEDQTGSGDEFGLSGFEYLMSGTTGQFNSNDMYLIQGEDTNEFDAIARDLGVAADLSGTPLNWRISHNLEGGRNFTFEISNPATSSIDRLCWGLGCAMDANTTSAETINGVAPIANYNGLQVQVRAQDVIGASTAVEILGLNGLNGDVLTLVDGDAPPLLYDEVVMPDTEGTIINPFYPFIGEPTDEGRRGQWFIADSLELTQLEWELFGTVTLTRPDQALTDRTKVRLAVDFVRDVNLPVPEPGTALLLGLGLAGLAGAARRHQPL